MKLQSLILTIFVASLTAVCAGSIPAKKMEALQVFWKDSENAEKSKKYEESINLMKKFISGRGDQYLASVRIGWLYYSDGNYKKAEQYYKAAARYSRGAISPLLGLMNTYQATGDDVKAARVAKSVLQLDSMNYTALVTLAGIYYKQKDYRNSASLYGKLTKAYPEDTTAMSGYAWSLYFTQKKFAAKSVFAKLLMISPDFSYAESGYKYCGGKVK